MTTKGNVKLVPLVGFHALEKKVDLLKSMGVFK